MPFFISKLWNLKLLGEGYSISSNVTNQNNENVISPFKNGEGKLSINFYSLQPGKSNYPYHQHYGREEAFYIISGTATLRTPEGEIEVKEGDIIVFPANEKGAHMLTNHQHEKMINDYKMK